MVLLNIILKVYTAFLGLLVFCIAYFFGQSNTTVSYHKKGNGEQIFYISGKNSFITIVIEKQKTKQILDLGY